MSSPPTEALASPLEEVNDVYLRIVRLENGQLAKQISVEFAGFVLQVADIQPRFATLLSQLHADSRFDKAAADIALTSEAPGTYPLWHRRNT